MVPHDNADRLKIHILPGVYSEKVRIPASKPYISLIGDPNQASATVITWHDKASDKGNDGSELGTENSASVAVESDYFCASWITFQAINSVVDPAIEGHQAVALRIAGDKSMFYNARFLGSQDTLLDEYGTHYFLHCFIQGSVDFIFGFARSLYRECTISVLASPYAITAHGRGSASDNTGYSFVNCTVSGNGPVYLGRAWGEYSRVIFSYTDFDINIFPQGWSDWGVPSRDNTVVFGEYQCEGKGANRRGRVDYSKALSDLEATPYIDFEFISGALWLRL
ncbi:pectinesterase qrt1 [Phtheirospermum japonicum]|uniref:Pectinesterase n=1 Tax=Phtheirospermum japonicum TaxID=374723 RepID=A0A830DG69_9LAMI|nr:pectinesterase qrt1 [Phtheirospermum japonicum]